MDLATRLRKGLALPVPGPAPTAALRAERRVEAGTVQELMLGPLPASLLWLETPPPPGGFPALLYCHAHGGEFDLGRREMMAGARWTDGPIGPDLAASGVAVLCIDMPGFGSRRAEGPLDALAKAGLWQGRPLFGRMLAEQQQALSWLAAHPRVDAARIAAFGVSMGGALAFWLAALDKRLAAAAHHSILADMGPMIANGAHDRHGLYLTVPGLLQQAEIGDVAALVAPRPHYVGVNLGDRLCPPEAVRPALERLRAAYGPQGALEIHATELAHHGEAPGTRGRLLDFLAHRAFPDTTTRLGAIS
ncbi:alpha/beta hydrolase family protein [Pseudoponticoccus marisrubri]|uniref:AB hydrolase-1 domain-containing protein n=1 Tax=Pseudoponticoccus marisrubri TaxID=1685382 RepID=A0A0W7WLS3_9RHOB|nr:alpha/beta fold hydrolase [Pseudoponticoccus marisrubri]KUF11538.1 hypothetical protein AVJ23_07195 [Pseudoponticoccus marisrubri]